MDSKKHEALSGEKAIVSTKVRVTGNSKGTDPSFSACWTLANSLLMITHVVAFYMLLRPQPKPAQVLAGDAAAS